MLAKGLLKHEENTLRSAVCLLLFAFLALNGTAAEAAGITALAVNPYGGEETDMDTVSWFISGGNAFLFLPADTDLPAAKVYFTAADEVTLDGEAIVSGGNNGGSSGVSFWQRILDWFRQIFSVIAGRFKR